MKILLENHIDCQRVTITSTIATDYGSQMAKRAFEDPSWLREHMKTWKLIKKDKPEELHMEAGDDKEAIEGGVNEGANTKDMSSNDGSETR